MRIDVYAQDGSPLGLTPMDIWGRGVGGAELSLMTWAETMAARGHLIRIYNDPQPPGIYSGVEYLPQRAFAAYENREAFVAWRSPNPHLQTVNAGAKIHWSTDQWTIGDYGRDIVPYVHRIVCISPYHMSDYQERYFPPQGQLCYIDLGVRIADYKAEIKRIPNRFIFCSVPERGLKIVSIIWAEIKAVIPNASLVITADHRLWGAPAANNQIYRLSFLNQADVSFLGAIPRAELIKHQLEAEFHLHPCTYQELFCISAAECQVSGAIPITSDTGALITTNEFGAIVPGNPNDSAWQKQYIREIVQLALNPRAAQNKRDLGQAGGKRRFDWDSLCQKWESLIKNILQGEPA